MYCDSFNTRKNLLLAITIRTCQHIFDKVFNRERDSLLTISFFFFPGNKILFREIDKTDFKYGIHRRKGFKSL